MGCCCSILKKVYYGADYDDELRDSLLPSRGVKEHHAEIYRKYLSSISFLRSLSDNNSVYKVKYQDRIGILKINYDMKAYLRELNVAKKLNNCRQTHKLISEEIFDNSTIVKGGILFYDFIPGIDLWKYFVDKNDKLQEVMVKQIIRSLLFSLKGLHDNNIIHADIKLENVICKNNNPSDCHIIDYGHSIINETDELLINQPHPCGTIPLVAPEIVISSKIGLCSDIWSVGCLMYLLLFYKHPFHNDPNLFNEAIVSCSSQIEDLKTFCYGRISDNCIDFIFKMLEIDVNKRATIDDLLEHNWIVN